MDLKQIHELIKIINKSNIGEISIEDKDGKVTIKQKEEPVVHVASQPHHVINVPSAPVAAPAPAPAAAAAPAPVVENTENLVTIKSPMIGTFYRRPSPDKPLLADVGTEIHPGKVVCIIEAMKLMNEIKAETSGKLTSIMVENAQPVEFGQKLFMIEPVKGS